MFNVAKKQLANFINASTHIAPLAVLRVAFGSIMLISVIRFILKGWVMAFYIKPEFHFTFYGFDWVKPLGATGMYLLFATLVVAAIMVTIGLFYRVAIITFFACFTYVELIDKTTYLNHYYFISVMAFLMIWVPAHRYFSVDIVRKPNLSVTHVPAWTINIFKLQLVLVYFFAGVSKLTYDWLILAVPLKIWLPAQSNLPIIGWLLNYTWVAYVFSWFGALFDLFIGFLLLKSNTRTLAYVLVVIFHIATGWFFKIGMFPYIMIFVTIIFFSADAHIKIINFLRGLVFSKELTSASTSEFSAHHSKIDTKVSPTGGDLEGAVGNAYHLSVSKSKIIYTILAIHFAIQLLLPFRFALYPGDLYWTEEGYRFSWRVMLMEKGGTAFFYVKDPATGRRSEIVNSQYLTSFQEIQMSTQPDMILQYAHILADVYRKKGIKDPIITAQSYVTLNGSGSRLYIDSTINLAHEQESFGHKRWILPFNNKN